MKKEAGKVFTVFAHPERKNVNDVLFCNRSRCNLDTVAGEIIRFTPSHPLCQMFRIPSSPGLPVNGLNGRRITAA